MKPWALITGASSGIGKAVALELAGCGYNLFLAAIDDQPLHDVGAECRRAHHVETILRVCDLADAQAVDSLVQQMAAAAVDFEILVNNAGFAVGGKFAETDLVRELSLLNLQLTATVKLTKAVLPGLIARQRGRILNVASVYAFAPVPFQAVYSACKAFLLWFSESLAEELTGTGVTVTALCPGTTRTEFRARAGIPEKNPNAGISPEALARIAVRQTLRGKRLVVPGLANRLFVFVTRRLPVSFVPRLTRRINAVRGVSN